MTEAAWARTARLALAWIPVGITFNSLVMSVGRVEGRSMQPTMNAEDGDREIVLLDKFSVQVAHRLVRGDVVVLKSPSEPCEYLTKRLIALEGDWVEGRSGRRVVVPAGKCWVEGDNAELSDDSNSFGCVPMALIEARVAAVVWPLLHIKRIRNEHPPNRIL
ncbi:signal peptidase I [Saprolegnia parasitica CBS 223.65]|uniref:Mitochondrial inner membrane protease subunit n=1 Tax=Saprolegnia parasitica (strain CBS 223.65) TaxID=695850 RepID=A0A067BGX1_SAPPC|nr:signal peptidase I [Saprolegnia parasitica CBS 223.65]KDO17413.1 signal peptidase I [Saprolegnia parasitica CBS 223.65]|eukprot:XP_012211879.1 signal peptidase I [Saprolegnia parasitica CBS 223.65]